jgi:hypothetical protein
MKSKQAHYPLLNKITIIRYDRQNFTIHLLVFYAFIQAPERFLCGHTGQNTKDRLIPRRFI